MKDLFRSRSGLIGGFLVLFFVMVALLSPWIAPYSADYLHEGFVRVPPVWAGGTWVHIFGTDDIGRDLLSRLLHGAPISLGIGFFVVLFSGIWGTILGLVAGTMGGWVDSVLSRAMDILMALPSMLMAIVVVAILGPSLINTVIAVGLVSIPSVFRLVRGAAMTEVKKNYVIAVKTFGSGWFRVAFVHVLPNCMAPLIVQLTLGFSEGILSAAGLGFLGLGAQAPLPEWGTMLSDARASIESASWMVTLPGLCILLIVVGFNLLGDALRDILDPKMRRS